MDPHVLVLAMSPLNYSKLFTANEQNERIPAENRYRFYDKKGNPGDMLYYGLGQLEPVPQFIESSERITHIIILQTKKTKGKIDKRIWDDIVAAFDKAGKPLENRRESCPPSHVEFFMDRMASMGIDAKYMTIDVNEDDTEQGFEGMLRSIRSLYGECENKANWRLWLDVHGGFRDASMAMFMLMQMLSAQDVHGKLKVYEKQEIIPVTAVYTVQYYEGPVEKAEHRIVERTDFYRRYTGDAFKDYMNWGQYLHTLLEPDDGNEPFCFISYKHGEGELNRVRFLSVLRDADVRYWFDTGIHLKENWRETLVEMNTKSAVFVLMLTKGYMSSLECLKELRSALDSGKPILMVRLDGTPIWTYGGFSAEQDGTRIEITAEEWSRLTAEQHVDMDLSSERYNSGGAFQRSKLEADLLALKKLDVCRSTCKAEA